MPKETVAKKEECSQIHDYVNDSFMCCSCFISAVMTSDTFNKGYQILGKNQDNEMVLFL